MLELSWRGKWSLEKKYIGEGKASRCNINLKSHWINKREADSFITQRFSLNHVKFHRHHRWRMGWSFYSRHGWRPCYLPHMASRVALDIHVRPAARVIEIMEDSGFCGPEFLPKFQWPELNLTITLNCKGGWESLVISPGGKGEGFGGWFTSLYLVG